MSTYNRGELLGDAVRSILAQHHTTPPFELIVVDNNSTDHTRAVVAQSAAADARVRYVFEPQQGSSHGRNAGISAACAPLIAFTDDDVRVEPDWIATIARAFDEHPTADVVGGRVLPIWPSPPPDWLTREHWMPLALIDYGDVPFAVDASNPMCLVTANCSFRRRVFDRVGGFVAEFGLGNGVVGSVEDHELQLRVLRAGGEIWYDPRIVVHAEIQPNRLTRAYHRRWHNGHGYFHALLRTEDMEQSRFGTVFGVPAHLYRQAAHDVIAWARASAARDRERAFRHELNVRFFQGFFRTRQREFAAMPVQRRVGELRQLIRTAVRRPTRPPAGRRITEGK
jgi:GT2 family glycosyltransferase